MSTEAADLAAPLSGCSCHPSPVLTFVCVCAVIEVLGVLLLLVRSDRCDEDEAPETEADEGVFVLVCGAVACNPSTRSHARVCSSDVRNPLVVNCAR